MKIVAYIDYFNNSLKRQMDIYDKTKDYYNLVLRNLDGKNFIYYEYDKTPNLYFGGFKIDVLDLGDFRFRFPSCKHEINIINNIASYCGVKSLIVYLSSKYSEIENIYYVRRIRKEFPHLKLILRFPPKKEGVNIKIFIEGLRIKNVSLYFNPTNLYLNKVSYLLTYRLLKQYIGFIALCDLDDKEEPILLGYGDLDYLDFFKRLYDNLYKGYIALDTNIDKIMKHFDKDERQMGALRKRNYYKFHYEYFQEKINGNTNEDITMEDIFLNQVKVLNDIFKI